MSELYELLTPYLDVPEQSIPSIPRPSVNDPQTRSYLTRLNTLSLSDLTSNEPESLLQSAQSHLRNLQALSKRSHKAVVASSSHLKSLSSLLPNLDTQASKLKDAVPQLETAASEFAQKYDRSTENAGLDRRKRAMMLSRNVDRVSDVLDLPSLLSSTVSAAQSGNQASATSTATSYASALDLQAHIKRLHALYPQSSLIKDISQQAEAEMRTLTTILIMSLQSPSLKLAAAMRTIGWLRRVAPDLAGDSHNSTTAPITRSHNLSSTTAYNDGAIGSLFLVCRLRMLNITLEALEPLRELADQENLRRKQNVKGITSKQQSPMSPLGSQSERYLKRYIETFREQSFSIISMYKSIFPSGLPSPAYTNEETSHTTNENDPLLPLPSPVSSFALHLVNMLTTILREYMPNVTDKSVRESLLTQVLYCAGSLGRLGADFAMAIALLEEDLAAENVPDETMTEAEEDLEWVKVMKKHRVQASRLEVLARGVGSGRKGSSSMEVQSPPAVLPAEP